MSPDLDPIISPELALVDPALASAARELLPAPGEFRPGWWSELVARSSAEDADPRVADAAAAAPREPVELSAADAPVQPVVRVADPPPTRRRRHMAGALAFAATAAVAFGLGYVVDNRVAAETVAAVTVETQTTSQPPPSRAAVAQAPARARTATAAPAPAKARAATARRATPPRQAAHRPLTRARVPHKTQATTTAVRRHTPARRPSVHEKVARPAVVRPTPPKAPAAHAAPRRPARRAAPKPAPALARFVPARVWAWVRVSAATAYRVTFTRAGRAFYAGTTHEPRLVLPARIVFRPGAYVWTVVPVVAGRARQAVVRSRFTVS